MTTTSRIPPLLKLALDLGPLAAFFIAYKAAGLTEATLALIPATFVSLGVGYFYDRKLSLMPLLTAVMVSIFGGLTLYLEDEAFIKMKPTFINLLFGALLLVGNAMGHPMLKFLLGSSIALTETGWSKLNVRWGLFFLFLAGLNEAVWRHFPTEFWVDFKVFGMFTCTLVFTLLQIPLMKRYALEENAPTQEP